MRILYFAYFIALLESAAAGPSKPELVLGVNSQSLEKDGLLTALEPTVKWQTSGKLADCDVEGGLTMAVTEKDNTAMPYSLWGRVKKTVGGVALSARLDTESSNMNLFALDLSVGKGDSQIQLKGNADIDNPSLLVKDIKVTQSLDAAGGRVTLAPRYDLISEKGDVGVTYAAGATSITVQADANKQKVTVSQGMGNNIGTIAPSISTTGEIQLGYSRPIGTGVLSANYDPNNVLSLSYTDGPWVVNLDAPVDGDFENYKDRIKASVRRSVDVTTI